MRPSTSYERQAVVRQAEKALSSIAVTDFIARHGIHVKARRVKVNGRRYDALRMPDGRDIVISEASNSFWQYADRYGFTGGGSVLQLAMVYLPEYQMKKGNWDEIVIKLAENECPDAVRLYAYRPVTQADSGRISLAERIRQIRSQQQPHQQSRDESRSRGEER